MIQYNESFDIDDVMQWYIEILMMIQYNESKDIDEDEKTVGKSI